MARLDLRVFIRAAPEQVWSILADFEGQKQWMVDLRKLDIVSETKSGVGTTMEVTSELFGLPVVKDRMMVDSWLPPRLYTVIHLGSFSGSGSFELVPVSGGTEFRWIEEFRPPLGPLGELGFAIAVGPHLRSVFSRSMDNVRRLAEAATASGAEAGWSAGHEGPAAPPRA